MTATTETTAGAADGTESAETPQTPSTATRRTSMSDSRGQTNLAGLFIGILVAAIIGISVFIPVVNDVIASSNVSGTTKTILDLLSMFAALLLLIAMASPLMRRT